MWAGTATTARLFACHASPVHYFIAQSLDALGSTRAGTILPNLIRSLPTDPDRALLPMSDDCETIVGRVIRRSGAEAAVVETCLAILGDPQAKSTQAIEKAIATTYQAWGGKPDPENRAAQILSAVCRDQRVRTADPRRPGPLPPEAGGRHGPSLCRRRVAPRAAQEALGLFLSGQVAGQPG